MKVLILGAGKMTENILLGLCDKIDMSEWSIYSPSGVSAKSLANKINAQSVSDLDSIKNPEWILVGCKPQQLESLKLTLKGRFENSLFVSILAAVSEADQLKMLGVKNLIRIMPNLAVKYNQGICLLSSNSASTQISRIEEIFNILGEVVKLSEDELEELTLLTGSGPAFFYEFANLLGKSFTSLSSKQREHLARKVLAAAAITVNNEAEPLDDLIGSVTSKGGVTIAVLEEWRKMKMDQFILEGVNAGKSRSKDLKKLVTRS